MYKKKLDPPELKSIYDDDDLEKSVLNNEKGNIDVELGDEQEPIGKEGEIQEPIGKEGEGEGEVQEPIGKEGEVQEPIGKEGEVQEPIGIVGDSSSSSEKSITFNRIKKKVVRKYMLIKNKIKTSSIDYKLDLINDAINKINSRINLLEIKVNNLELDVNKNKNELLEHDRLTSIEMTNIHDKLNNANIIILD
jgi:hypothetical protein